MPGRAWGAVVMMRPMLHPRHALGAEFVVHSLLPIGRQKLRAAWQDGDYACLRVMPVWESCQSAALAKLLHHRAGVGDAPVLDHSA